MTRDPRVHWQHTRLPYERSLPLFMRMPVKQFQNNIPARGRCPRGWQIQVTKCRLDSLSPPLCRKQTVGLLLTHHAFPL